jgi:hypothetical protein
MMFHGAESFRVMVIDKNLLFRRRLILNAARVIRPRLGLVVLSQVVLVVFGTWEASEMGVRCLHPPAERKCVLRSKTRRGEQFLAYFWGSQDLAFIGRFA